MRLDEMPSYTNKNRFRGYPVLWLESGRERMRVDLGSWSWEKRSGVDGSERFDLGGLAGLGLAALDEVLWGDVDGG